MDILGNLLGGQQRSQYEDFANRYDQGAPWDGIDDREAVDRYRQVAPHLPPEMYQQSAEQAFSRLTPQQRLEFGRYLQSRARERNVSIPDFDRDGIDDRLQDPHQLARMTTQVQQRQPDPMESLLGGGGGGMGGGGMGGGMLQNPIGKAALGGIAAMAFRQMMGRR